MKNNILFDTSIGSMNKGDEIIMMACEKELKNLLDNSYVARFPTHTPSFTFLQQIANPRASFVRSADYKFICGTNLLYTSMIRRLTLWNINFFNSFPLRNSILMGVGSWGKHKKIGFMTRFLYKKVLSSQYVHSTRDERTRKLLEGIGINAINTGCPTLWGLNEDFCKQIPTQKSENVIITLNGTHPSVVYDQHFINIINKIYNKKYIWIQSPVDLDYLNKFDSISEFEIINPSVSQFSDFLNHSSVDYVGTRLHAGIFAMQHKKRSVIIAIDSRAREITKTNNLNCIEYSQLGQLEEYLCRNIFTNIYLNEEAIRTWNSQFHE